MMRTTSSFLARNKIRGKSKLRKNSTEETSKGLNPRLTSRIYTTLRFGLQLSESSWSSNRSTTPKLRKRSWSLSWTNHSPSSSSSRCLSLTVPTWSPSSPSTAGPWSSFSQTSSKVTFQANTPSSTSTSSTKGLKKSRNTFTATPSIKL